MHDYKSKTVVSDSISFRVQSSYASIGEGCKHQSVLGTGGTNIEIASLIGVLDDLSLLLAFRNDNI
eukprot:4351066-Amphidinium_carterae.1